MTDMNGSATENENAVENGTGNCDKSGNRSALPVLETDKEREERRRSLWIVYFTMFLISLGFSIVLTGIWPYLDKVCCVLNHAKSRKLLKLMKTHEKS
jgi:hypothetical protein